MKNHRRTKLFITLSLFIIVLSACSKDKVLESHLEYVPQYSTPPLSNLQNEDTNQSIHETTIESQIEQIKNGNFSILSSLSDYNSELLESIYTNPTREGEWVSYPNRELEWVECELNENGLRGLIWQEKYSDVREANRIIAIFAIKSNESRLVLQTTGMQMTDWYYLSKNGNIIRTYSIYGTADYCNYHHYIVNDDWMEERVVTLSVCRIWDWAIEEAKKFGSYDWLMEDDPRWAEAGIYYTRFVGEDAISIDEQQFIIEFKEMTGYSFYDDNPVKPAWTEWLLGKAKVVTCHN